MLILHILSLVWFYSLIFSQGRIYSLVDTIMPVNGCPTTREEWIVASMRKNCSAKNSRNGIKLQYHCVINEWANGTVEVCAANRLILFGKCAEYNYGGKRIQSSGRKICSKFNPPCPRVYNSSYAYMYQGCYNFLTTMIGFSVSTHPPNPRAVSTSCLKLGIIVSSVNNRCCEGFYWNEDYKNCTECPLGYIGCNCSIVCVYSSYGEKCRNECTCRKQYYHSSFGCQQSFITGPVDGGWTNFTYSWSPCTVTCGRGIQSGQEHRTCTNPRPSKDGKPCVGSLHGRKASRDCNTQPCPVDGQWSVYGPFGEWSKCSKSCGVRKGIKQRVRKRYCNNPAPQYGGKSCPGSNVNADRRQCNVNPCPVDGGWSEFVPYADWSRCSVTCNNGTQTRVRIRTCSEPAPLYGGRYCSGHSIGSEQRQCITADCPVNGAWSVFGAFSDWSECSETCGEGSQERSRYRVCNNPSPKHGGKACKGSIIVNETRKCNTQPCPVHGRWSKFSPYSEWSTCPVTCGGGNQTRSRTRRCNNPLPEHNGFNCTGSVEEIANRKCNSNVCPEGVKQTSTQTVIIIAVVLSILTILIFSTVSTLYQRRKIWKTEHPVEMQTRDVVYEEIQNIRLRNHDYVPSYTEYVLNPRLRNRPEHGVELSSVLMDLRSHAPILLNTDFNDGRPSTICIQEINQENEESALYPNDTSITGDMNDQRMAILAGNQNENNDAGSEIYFDVANTQGNGISNVNGYEEPAVKTRNSYIVILPNVTDLEGVSEDHCDSIASYENNEPGKGEDMDSEFSLNLAKYMGENCNSRSHPIGKDSLDGNKIQVLQSDYDASDDERESAEYIKPLRVRPHSYVTVLPMIEVHNADVCSSLDT